MANNIYFEKTTGEQVTILNEDANFYTLDNSVRIKKDVFTKRYEQREEVDPNSFFKKPVNDPIFNLANQIKSLDTTKIPDTSEGTKIKYTPPITVADNSMPPSEVKQKQTEEIIHLDAEQKKAMLEEWRRTQPGAQIPEIQDKNWSEIDDEKFLHGDKPIQSKTPEPKIDPLEMMFKMFKNNYPVKFKIEIEENIPNPHFIEMVQENVEADAVEYYATKILDNLLNDPSKLKTEIYNQLKNIMSKGTKKVSKTNKDA